MGMLGAQNRKSPRMTFDEWRMRPGNADLQVGANSHASGNTPDTTAP
jgi:hypothetical protein